MSRIKFDQVGQEIVVEMTFTQGKLRVAVHAAPNVRKGQFDITKVRVLSGNDLSSGDKAQIEVAALKELMAWFKSRLAPPKKWVRVSGFEERIDIAFLHTLTEYDAGTIERLKPLGDTDRIVLYDLAARIRDRYSQEKRTSGQVDWQEIKREVLTDWRKECPVSDAHRDFYSQVLARSNAWKHGRIPREVYERVKDLQPGLELAFRLQ